MTEFEHEQSEDRDAVEALFDLAFAPGRSLLSSYRLRIGAEPVADLCLIARDEFGSIVGAIRYWPIRIGSPGDPDEVQALLLGPVAVHPTRQSEGLGARLILSSLEKAAELGWTACLLVGDEPYYRRFGFRRALVERVAFPNPTNPKRVLGLELVPGALARAKGPARAWADGASERASTLNDAGRNTRSTGAET